MEGGVNINSVAQVADMVILILSWAIIARAILSFFPQLRYLKLVQLLNDVTDPLLKPFRRFQMGGSAYAVDFSPLLALLALNILSIIIRSIF